MHISRLKVGWVAPCVGIGGADAFMLGLIKHCHNLTFTGIAIADSTSVDQLDWVQSYIGDQIKFEQIGHDCPRYKGWGYHGSFADAIYAACEDADIIITWGCKNAYKNFYAMDKPIVELAQNEDNFAREIVVDNDSYIDFRVAVSDTVAKIFPVEPDRVIYNGIDPSRCCPRYGRNAVREMWGLENRKVILYMGRLVDEKNPAALLGALTHLPPEWCVLYVGRGYRQGDLVKEAQRHAGVKRVYFAPPQFHVGDLFASCDVFALPSDFEGLPLSVCEAWLAGVPTVCTDFNVMVELREKFGPLSTYVPKRCPATDLAKGILRADSKSKEVLNEMGTAQSVTWQNFTLPTIAAQWEETLHQFYHAWFTRRSRMQVYEVGSPQPLTTSKAHLTMIDTSQESISKWDKMK